MAPCRYTWLFASSLYAQQLLCSLTHDKIGQASELHCYATQNSAAPRPLGLGFVLSRTCISSQGTHGIERALSTVDSCIK